MSATDSYSKVSRIAPMTSQEQLDSFLLHYRTGFRENVSRMQIEGIGKLMTSLQTDKDMTDIRWQAYLLGTIKHEVGNTCQPIKERGGEDYFIRRYWTNKKRRMALGNLSPEDAVRFSGHGYVQCTGRGNFITFGRILGIDLVNNPELALEHDNAYKIASIGMRRGKFTGRAFRHYINDTGCDFYKARKIINGFDQATLIANHTHVLLT